MRSSSQASSTSATAPTPRTAFSARGSRLGVMFCVMLGPFVNILDYNVVNVSLPKMMSGLGTDVLTIRWVVISFLSPPPSSCRSWLVHALNGCFQVVLTGSIMQHGDCPHDAHGAAALILAANPDDALLVRTYAHIRCGTTSATHQRAILSVIVSVIAMRVGVLPL